MREDSRKALISFAADFPRATAGVFIPTRQLLISGHENGMVVKWDAKTKKPEVIHRCQSTVESMALSPPKRKRRQ
jgi:hypothetical protein